MKNKGSKMTGTGLIVASIVSVLIITVVLIVVINNSNKSNTSNPNTSNTLNTSNAQIDPVVREIRRNLSIERDELLTTPITSNEELLNFLIMKVPNHTRKWLKEDAVVDRNYTNEKADNIEDFGKYLEENDANSSMTSQLLEGMSENVTTSIYSKKSNQIVKDVVRNIVSENANASKNMYGDMINLLEDRRLAIIKSSK